MSGSGRISSQYASAANVPLIKAPTLWLPRPVTMPDDIHPLPADIGAYFLYPYTLEPHILAQTPPIHERIRSQRIENEKFLADRLDQAKREKAEEMNRMAPGWNPASFLTPQHLSSTATPISITGLPAPPLPLSLQETRTAQDDAEAAFRSLKM